MNEQTAHFDVFGGKSHSEVVATHLPHGIRYEEVRPEGLPPLTLEYGVFVPKKAPAGAYQRVMVMPYGFPNPLVSEGTPTEHIKDERAVNKHGLRAGALAEAVGRPVYAFGFPDGEGGDQLPRELRKAVKKGDFSSVATYMVEVLKKTGVKEVDIDGFSLGGALTPDLCLKCVENGIIVKNVFMGAVANAITEDGAIELAKRFARGTGTPDSYTTLALTQEAERHASVVRGAGRKAVGVVLHPTQRAFAIGMAHGQWLDGPMKYPASDPAQKMANFLNQNPDVQVHLYVGELDRFAPPRGMQELAQKLGLPLDVLPDKTHSVRDNLAFMQDYFRSRMKN